MKLARPKAAKAYQTESAKALSDEQMERRRVVIRLRAGTGDLSALRDYALYLLFAISGMRHAEVIGLRGQGLEFREGGIAATCRVKGGDYLGRMISSPAVKAPLLDYLTASGRMCVLGKGGPLWVRHDRGR